MPRAKTCATAFPCSRSNLERCRSRWRGSTSCGTSRPDGFDVIRYLLDMNVLIALVDPVHVQHDAAHEWFALERRHAWATCPMTENGLLRIVGHPRYPNSPGTPAVVAGILGRLRELPGMVLARRH